MCLCPSISKSWCKFKPMSILNLGFRPVFTILSAQKQDKRDYCVYVLRMTRILSTLCSWWRYYLLRLSFSFWGSCLRSEGSHSTTLFADTIVCIQWWVWSFGMEIKLWEVGSGTRRVGFYDTCLTWKWWKRRPFERLSCTWCMVHLGLWKYSLFFADF